MVMKLERDGRSTTMMMIRSEAFVEAELAYRAGLRGSALHLHEVERAGRRHPNRWFRTRRGVLGAPAVPASARAVASAPAGPAPAPAASMAPAAPAAPSATGATIIDIKAGRRPGAAA